MNSELERFKPYASSGLGEHFARLACGADASSLTRDWGDKPRAHMRTRRFGEAFELDGPPLVHARDAGAIVSAPLAVDGGHSAAL